MNICTRTFRCINRQFISHSRGKRKGLPLLQSQSASHIQRHGYSFISPKSLNSASSNFATATRNYASSPLTLQPNKSQSNNRTAAANTQTDGQNDKDQVPAYDLTFTCKKCLSRSTHRVSKQGFYKGTVLITCPGCKNRHLISDHLKVRLYARSESILFTS